MECKKMKNKKNLFAILAIFSFILAAGIVYATASGNLTFNGTVNLAANLKLNIVDVSSGDDDLGQINLSDDKQSATITVNFKDVDDTVTFSFKVENVGNVDAEITAVTFTGMNGLLKDRVTINGGYGDLDGSAVAVGAATNSYNITLTCNDASVSGTDTFTIKIEYSAAA